MRMSAAFSDVSGSSGRGCSDMKFSFRKERLVVAAVSGATPSMLPGYVCREDVRSGALRRVLPAWLAGDSTITALIPYRQGLLPSVRVFIDHLAAAFPQAVLI